MGVFIGTLEFNNKVQSSAQAVKTFLVNTNGEELYIAYNYYNNSIDIIPSGHINKFIETKDLSSPTWKLFLSHTYELMLIVLERMIIDRVMYEFSFDISKLEDELKLRQGEISLAKKNIKIIS